MWRAGMNVFLSCTCTLSFCSMDWHVLDDVNQMGDETKKRDIYFQAKRDGIERKLGNVEDEMR